MRRRVQDAVPEGADGGAEQQPAPRPVETSLSVREDFPRGRSKAVAVTEVGGSSPWSGPPGPPPCAPGRVHFKAGRPLPPGPFDVRARVLASACFDSLHLQQLWAKRLQAWGAVSLCKPPGGLPRAGVPDLLASRADARSLLSPRLAAVSGTWLVNLMSRLSTVVLFSPWGVISL